MKRIRHTAEQIIRKLKASRQGGCLPRIGQPRQTISFSWTGSDPLSRHLFPGQALHHEARLGPGGCRRQFVYCHGDPPNRLRGDARHPCQGRTGGMVVAYSLELQLQHFEDRWASFDVADTTVALVRRDWILFFDEVHPVFCKRSETKDAHVSDDNLVEGAPVNLIDTGQPRPLRQSGGGLPAAADRGLRGVAIRRPTCTATSTRPSCAASRRWSTYRNSVLRNGCGTGGRLSRPGPM